ncbi:hypothetical protein FXO37_03281 [Capsicum annuum]|nr:hypothetical protein FXO37_03281 [Capsicum annuum]
MKGLLVLASSGNRGPRVGCLIDLHGSCVWHQGELLSLVPDPERTILICDYNADKDARGLSRRQLGISKPDIMAPGVLILASVLPNLVSKSIQNLDLSSDYELQSGTSMASPHAVGIAAMLKGTHLEWSSSTIHSTIMTTENHLDNTQKSIK